MSRKLTEEERARANDRQKEMARGRWLRYRARHVEKYRIINRANVRKCVMKSRYGITIEEYQARQDAQGGACYVCRTVPPAGKRLSVDHCHASGRVRKLLCNQCNAALGFARESPQLLMALAGYLHEHAELVVE